MKKGVIAILVFLCLFGLGAVLYINILKQPKETVQNEKIKLKLMHYYGDSDTDISAQYLKKILKEEFPKAFPNVELEQDVSDNQTYKSKIKVLMAADEIPDIFFSYGAGFSDNFVKAGKILPLDTYLDSFYLDHINRNAQENFLYDGKYYGVCFSSWKGVLYCNKALFRKAGADIPKTYEELIDASRTLRKAGIEPVACGMTNQWQGQQWINNFTIQLGGAKLYNDMAKGKESFNNPALIKAAQLTADLVDYDVFCKDMLQMSSSEAENMFLNGKAAMIYIGSWYTEQAEQKLGDDLEVAMMPVVPGALALEDYHGGAINGWMVSSKTKYPETAANIAAWLAYRLNCYQPESGTFNIEQGDEKRPIGTTSQKIIDLLREKVNGGVAWDTLLQPDDAETWLNDCSSLFQRKVTGVGFVRVLENNIRQEEIH